MAFALTTDVQLEYEASVREAVQRALNRGATSFPEICGLCNGAYPTDIWKVLRAGLADVSLPSSTVFEPHVDDLATSHEGWPEPAPMDFEWRFTGSTSARVALIASRDRLPVVCVGTPSVFAHLCSAGIEAILIERNPIITNFLAFRTTGTIHTVDVAALPQELVGKRFHTVVMDSPWYPRHILYWLQQSLKMATDGARILFTLFPSLTRPSAAAERAALSRRLTQLGRLESLGILEYETPLFEQESLKEAGIPVLPRWRAGELIQLTVGDASEARLEVDRPDEGAWCHFLFGSQVVGLRTDACPEPHISIDALYPDGSYLLKSVSARDPVRLSIGVWTSRNRCARVIGLNRVRSFLTLLQSGETPYSAVHHLAQSEAEERSLERLVALIGL